MDPGRTGGDICVRRAPTTRRLPCTRSATWPRVGFGTASVRYSQLGFGRTSSTTRDQATPRNLFGFKDGTNNIKSDETQVLDDNIWVPDGDGPSWLAGGTYMVTRRIRMRIESWDRTTLLEQERVIGREKGTGAPLGQSDEFDKLNFRAKNAEGERRSTSSPTSDWPRRNSTTASRSCAAATTSPTAQTDSAIWTPGCSSSRSSATRPRTLHPHADRTVAA
jgi:deferrochelatase/peroxidase EfeB